MAYSSEKYALCNSNGLDLEDRISCSMCYAIPLVSDGGEMYDGFKNKMGDLKDFDIKAIAEEAVEDAVSTIGAESVLSGKYTVIFPIKPWLPCSRPMRPYFPPRKPRRACLF